VATPLVLQHRANEKLTKGEPAARPAAVNIAQTPQGQWPVVEWPVGEWVPKGRWGDAGLATPEATVQTMFWAMANGNGKKYLQTVVGAGDTAPSEADLQSMSATHQEQLASVNGIRLDACRFSSDNQAALEVTMSIPKDKDESWGWSFSANENWGLVLHRQGEEWKVVGGRKPMKSVGDRASKPRRDFAPNSLEQR